MSILQLLRFRSYSDVKKFISRKIDEFGDGSD